MRATIYLAIQALFAKNLKVDPSETQKILVFANIPYSFKIVYGLVVDNMHIGRSRKKYLLDMLRSTLHEQLRSLPFGGLP